MAHRLRQTSTIFRQVEILLAHQRKTQELSEQYNSRAFSGGAEELQARARRQKRRQRASKGDGGETGCTAQQDGRETPTQWRTRAHAYISNTYIVGKATEICQVNIVDASHEPGVPMQIAKQMHQ